MGARKYVLHTFATTQSALMKKRVAQFMIGSPCALCEGKRLKREALAIKFAGVDIGTLSALPLNRVAELLAPAAAGQFAAPKSPARAARSRPQAPAARRGAAHQGAPDVRPTYPKRSASRRSASRKSCWRASPPCRSSGWVICRSSAAPRLCPRASCSACAWPPRFARTCLASSTCSMSPRRAYTRQTARR